MSVAQAADLVINLLGFGTLLWLSAVLAIRWIRAGRVESYSVDGLTREMPSWTRWLLAPTFVVTPAPPSMNPGSKPRTAWGITRCGWLCLGCLAVWALAQAM